MCPGKFALSWQAEIKDFSFFNVLNWARVYTPQIFQHILILERKHFKQRLELYTFKMKSGKQLSSLNFIQILQSKFFTKFENFSESFLDP